MDHNVEHSVSEARSIDGCAGGPEAQGSRVKREQVL